MGGLLPSNLFGGHLHCQKTICLVLKFTKIFQTNGIDKTKHSFNEFTNYHGSTLMLEG